MRGMVVYYSYSGHTRQVAKAAARAAGWRLIELTVTPPYTGGYWKMVARVGSEMVTDNTSRTVIPSPEIIRDADRIILAMPTWWFTYARPFHRWVQEAEWGKCRLYGLLTCGGQPGRSRSDLAKDSGGALRDMLIIDCRSGNPIPNEREIAAWVNDIVMKG